MSQCQTNWFSSLHAGPGVRFLKKKKMSTRALVLTSTATAITIGFIITVGLLLWQSSQQQKHIAQQYLTQMTYSNIALVEDRFNDALASAHALSQGMITLRENGNPDRSMAEAMLKNTLKIHPELLSMSVVWEPNSFDGKDKQFASQPNQAPQGRFARYAERDSTNNIILHGLSNYDTAGSGDYYQIPRQKQKEVVLDPFRYNNSKTLRTSVAVPILINGTFYGSVTADISLENLQNLAARIHPYPHAYAQIFSHTGVFIAHPDKNRLGQRSKNSQALLDGIKDGKVKIQQRFSDTLNTDVFNINAPITIGHSDTPWVLGLAIPVDEVMAETIKQRNIAIVMTLLSITIVCSIVGIIFTRKVLRIIGGEPGDAAEIALAVARGDLTREIKYAPKDNRSIFYAMSVMQTQLKAITERLMITSDAVHQCTTEIMSGNTHLASRTEQQAAALQQTAASMEQITATVKQNTDNARCATQLANNAAQIAERGDAVTRQVNVIMKEIDDKSKKISEIISIIDSIAFQTNILSLNAAVEAARAGEQGRSFAVVAGEVRNLAQRSANAAKDISQMINDSVSRVDNGVKLVDNSASNMQEILSAITSVKDMMEEIFAASEEQANGISQVTLAVHKMDGVTQKNTALVEASSGSMALLEKQADDLKETMQTFKLA